MDFKDYYQTLGLGKTASGKEIKQAYRKLARKHHPDVNPGDKVAEARFKEINEAYEVLGDPEKRKKYDELGANWRQYEQAQQAGQSPFGDIRWGDGPAKRAATTRSTRKNSAACSAARIHSRTSSRRSLAAADSRRAGGRARRARPAPERVATSRRRSNCRSRRRCRAPRAASP